MTKRQHYLYGVFVGDTRASAREGVMALTYPRDTEYARLQAQADAADREFMEAIFILTGKLDRWEVTETERRYPMIAARRAAKIAADRALCDYVAGRAS